MMRESNKHEDKVGGDEHGRSNRVCHHGAMDTHREHSDVICLDDVTYAYNDVEVLSGVNLHIEAGCNLGIIGPNGGGKTTLLKIMLGLLVPLRGTIRVLGLEPDKICRRGDLVGYLPQHHEFEARFPVSVRQVVRMGLVGKTGLFRGYNKDDKVHIEYLLEQVGVSGLADRPIGDLSGGQQQRVFIARALSARPRVLLMDEPMVGIDTAGQRNFARLVHQLHESLDLTIVTVSHDLRAVAASCGKVAVLNRSIHYHDSPNGLTPELLHEVYQHNIVTPILSV